jgi:hypothetical protein
MNSKKVQVAKLFRSKGVDASHIWLEGDRLVEAGFTAGVEYLQTWYKDKLVLTKANASGQFVHEHEPVKTIMRKVVKSGNNPAIRIEGMQVLRTFGKEFGFVQCTFSPRRDRDRRLRGSVGQNRHGRRKHHAHELR